MTRIKPINPTEAEGKAKDLLDSIQGSLGTVPNIFKVMVNSPAALVGFMNFKTALSNGVISPELTEKLALVAAGKNGCTYCASAHTAIGKKAGIDADELAANLAGNSSNEKDAAALAFSASIIEKKGHLDQSAIDAVRSAGFTDEEIIEILTHTCLNIFTNYFNEVFDTENDFPEIKACGTCKAA